MNDLLANFFLYFAQINTVLAFFIAGYCLSSTKYCIRLAIICTLGVLINVALKGWFKVPLANFIHHAGYAFPSGHTQFATVFYGYIGLFGLPKQSESDKSVLILRLLITVSLILGIGFGLVHYHYHTIQDVIAGFVVGLIIIFCYKLALRHLKKSFSFVLLIVGSLIMLINFMLYNHLAPYVWVAYGALCVLLYWWEFQLKHSIS